MREKMPSNLNKKERQKEKTEEQKLKEEWKNKLQDEGLGENLKPLEEELNSLDSTPRKAVAAYAEARRFDPKLAKEIASGYGREGQHKDAARAIANRFNISLEESEELIDEHLKELDSDEDASLTDLWRRFKSRI